jgi:nondiscriminating glutamyl-tRNA synthetase
MTVKTRFAPSPTGELHLGNARIAVLNWLYARHSGGRFVLRIEDTDVDRNLPGSEDEIMESLRRLGVTWDEGPDVGGAAGPYRQSERTALYRDYAEKLLKAGAAFHCYCQPDELEVKKEAAIARGARAVYDGTCRRLTPEQEERYREQGRVPAIRFRVPADQVVVNDIIRGTIVFEPEEFGDFVIVKSDGLPTYNFAVVVDDCGMAITHVIRGVGHLANTPRQVMLYHALDIEPPTFVHVPHVLSPDGAGLSKRHSARSLREYLDEGYHPDALVNYLSLLSWSSRSGDEVLPPDRLIGEIDLARLGASDVKMDPDKLEWLSGEYIRQMSPGELAARLAEHLDPESYPDRGEDRVRIARAIQQRITTFNGAARFLPQFYPPVPMSWTPEALEVLQAPEASRTLAAVHTALETLEEWSGEAIIAAIRAAGTEAGAKGKKLFMPVRAAVSGSTQGPELADIFEIQGRDTSLRVIAEARAKTKQT